MQVGPAGCPATRPFTEYGCLLQSKAMESSAKSALGSARDRFVEGLARRADELSGAIAELAADPEGRASRDNLMRKLQALLANAELFELYELSECVAAILMRLGELGTRPPLEEDDFTAFNDYVARIHRMASERPPVAHSGIHKLTDGSSGLARAASIHATLQGVAPALHSQLFGGPEVEAGAEADAQTRDAVQAVLAAESQPLAAQTDSDASADAALNELAADLVSEPLLVAPPLTAADELHPGVVDQVDGDTVGDPVQPLESESADAVETSNDRSALFHTVADDAPVGEPTGDETSAPTAQTVHDLTVHDNDEQAELADSEHPDLARAPALLTDDLPVVLTQTVPGMLATPVRPKVLLVCSRPHALRFQELLEGQTLELLHAADAEEAIRLLHAQTPNCALVSAEFANLPDIDLIRRLQTDPLSRLGGVHVVLPKGASYDGEFVRQTGADAVLVEPLTAQQVVALAEQSSRRSAAARSLRALSAGTVDEIASHVAEEIRRGIATSLRAGQHERIDLGDSHELMSAAWSAIGRVRSHLAEQSRGKVSFRDNHARELPAFMTQENKPGAFVTSLLAGQRVLVADDDPAVLWFFSGLLREASAQVLQAQNGREALELARRKQPQLILSDILMPKIDGFALCRELKRDALLAHIPVILLSWKDDLLDRMRELDAGASAYVRKESGSREILDTIASVLRPRADFAQALASEGEVLGRVEALGIVPLLETVAAARPDARITVQDAWNLFEVELRAGQRVSVTRTAADGAFARGERALLQLLGVNAGRYSVHVSTTSLRSPLAESFGAALQSAGKALSALLDAVSDTRLVHVALLAFEEDVVELLQRCTPTRLREVVSHFRVSGSTAKDLLFEGSFTPVELEGHLRELARCGAINGVWDAQGDDLVARARRAREEQPGTLLHSSKPPSAPQVSFSTEPRAASAFAVATSLQPPDASAAQPDAASAPEQHAAEPPDALRHPVPGLDDDEEFVLPRRRNPIFELLRLLLTLAALVTIGYLGWQRLEPHTGLGSGVSAMQGHAAPAARHPAASASHAPPAITVPSASSSTPAGRLERSASNAMDHDPMLGHVLPYVDVGRGVAVGPEQGLLVVEYEGVKPAPNVRVSGRELGRPPIAIALNAGRHELVVRQNRESSFRYLIVRAGETRVITLPL